MIKNSVDKSFTELGMQILTTTFTSAGDYMDVQLSRPGVTKDTYGRRHVLKEGDFHIDALVIKTFGQINMTVTERLSDNYTHAPFSLKTIPFTEDFENVSGWKMTAKVDDSTFFCINPIDKRKMVQDERFNVKANTAITCSKGNIYFAGADLLINGVIKKACTPLICINNDVQVIAQNDCEMIRYYLDNIEVKPTIVKTTPNGSTS